MDRYFAKIPRTSVGSTSSVPSPDSNLNPIIDDVKFNSNDIVSDPGRRKPIESLDIKIRDNIRRGRRGGDDAFVKTGFSNWRRATVKFSDHVGDVTSSHNQARELFENFKNQEQSITRALTTGKEVMDDQYRKRLTASLQVARFLLKQGLPFRGDLSVLSDLGDRPFAVMVDESRDDLGNLGKKLVETMKHKCFPLVYRLIEFALILPVATASVERVFSAMNVVKTRLRNKMGDEWMNDCLVVYIEREVFMIIDDETILQRFQNMENRRCQLSRVN